MSVASFCVQWHNDSVDMPTAPEKCRVDAKVCSYVKKKSVALKETIQRNLEQN